MADRRLWGILVMAGILSTAFTLLFFSETTQERIEVIKNHWDVPSIGDWQRLAMSEGAVPYTLSIVARKPIGDLVLRFGVLRNRTFEANFSGWEELSLREKAMRVDDLGFLEARAWDVSRDMEVRPVEQSTTIDLGGESYDLVLMDYSPFMYALAPPEASIRVPVLFAFAFDSTGNISQFYSGHWDFFFDRAESIQDLTIQVNENSTRYANEQNMMPASLAIDSSLPMLGTVGFRNLSPDDRVFVTFRVNGAAVSGDETIMQIVRVAVEGEHLDPLVNVLKR